MVYAKRTKACPSTLCIHLCMLCVLSKWVKTIFRVWLVFNHPYGLISLHLISIHPIICVWSPNSPWKSISSLKVCDCVIRRRRKETKLIFEEWSTLDMGFSLHLQRFKGIKLATWSFNHVYLEMGVLVILFGPKFPILSMVCSRRFMLSF